MGVIQRIQSFLISYFKLFFLCFAQILKDKCFLMCFPIPPARAFMSWCYDFTSIMWISLFSLMSVEGNVKGNTGFACALNFNSSPA